MKAVVYEKSTGGNALQLREVAQPVPLKNEVLIKIANTALNAADYRSLALGIIPKSRIFGADVAGVVSAAGPLASRFQVGDAVFGDLSASGFGGLAEYVAAPERLLARIPEGVPFEQAAALPMAALTALQGLRDQGKLRAGQRVLIYGAGGGVGLFAVQLARHFGAQVSAVCGPATVELVRSLGADEISDYVTEDITRGGKKFDLVLGINGSQPLSAYKRLLAPKGIFVAVGGGLPQVLKTMFFGPLLSLGGKKMRLLAAKPSPPDLDFVIALVKEGKLKVVIDRRYPLEQAAEALSYLRQGHARGKVIIHSS